MTDDERVAVTVVGGGISGITAALKLAQRGYAVTLYEQQPFLGGNLAAHPYEIPDGPDKGETIWHDVYPHLFSTFYENFWSIVEDDLGWKRETHFQPRECVKILRKDGKYVTMTDGQPIRNAWNNLWRGILPPADMYLWVYSMLDLMSQPIHRRELLDTYSVNGFVGSRPYGTDRAASLHDFILMVVWSAHSYGVPAASYKDFFRFSLRQPSPLTWVLRGNLHECLMQPLEEKLEALGVTIKKSHEVTRVTVHNGRVDGIVVQKAEPVATSSTEVEVLGKGVLMKVDNLILAVNPQVAGELAQAGDWGDRLVDWIPGLSETRRAVAEPIAVLNLYFKSRLPGMPLEHTSIWNSRMNLTFLDLSQAWDSLAGGPTVLTVAASNYYGLPAEALEFRGEYEDSAAMILELGAVLGPQVRLDNIDRPKCRFQTVKGNHLFINTVGSETWRPSTAHEALPNFFLAGDYCLNPVGMATVEGAVTAGLQAARALHEWTPLGQGVEVIEHEAYSDFEINAMKLAMMPAAYWAKWWSATTDAARDVVSTKPMTQWGPDVASLWSLPAHCAVDLWETSNQFWASSLDYFSKRR